MNPKRRPTTALKGGCRNRFCRKQRSRRRAQNRLKEQSNTQPDSRRKLSVSMSCWQSLRVSLALSGDSVSQSGRGPEVLLSRLTRWRKSDYTQALVYLSTEYGVGRLAAGRFQAFARARDQLEISPNSAQLLPAWTERSKGWRVGDPAPPARRHLRGPPTCAAHGGATRCW